SEKDKIVFGNERGMSVISYEGIPLVEQYGHNSWGYTIDLNGDGQHDVQFHSTSEIAEGGILTELYCKHTDIALLGDLIDQKFTLFANDAKDSFGDDGTFMSTDVKLREGDKYYFPKDETKYIGFKIREENGANKLGWLKIKLISKPDGTHRLRLLETAIQK
ncbi:MAG: hypothetical protein IIT63_05375, partial [Prevotella sp.]|nr:hypothetical protein [Prevotella sp.]